MATGKSQKQSSGGSALGFEATLWATADKLRGNGNLFVNDCIPALVHRGIFVEIENRGAGQQRHWKLGRPMAVLDEALENCGGLFSQFLDLATR
jgi:hypothetical protein